MSSGTPTTPALSQLPSIGTSGGGGSDHSASYFFGFLVAFAVLLVLFVVAGFVSRHRLQARRHASTLQAGTGVADPWEYGHRERRMYEARKVKPVWMERWFEDPDTSEKVRRASVDSNIGRWGDIMPLSVIITCLERDSKPNGGVSEENTRRSSMSTISPWLSSLSTTKYTDRVRNVDPSPSHLTIQDAIHNPKVGVDVVVMIALPRSANSWGYEFGVANIPIMSRVNTDNVT